MAQTYRSKQGDVLDAIAYEQYGQCTSDTLNIVMEANPDLRALVVLPAGVLVNLPDMVVTPTPSKAGVSLWD
jgi:phage tail protein X